MRTTWLLAGGVFLAGCFDEGGDEARTQSAVAVADGLIAFADIKDNITTDPAAAGEALLLFIQTPVAADNLISPPTDLGVLTAARVVAPDAVPACLTTDGSEGCDSFETNAGAVCEAGPFTFTGDASRTCDVCTDVTGRCTYDWHLTIGYVLPSKLDLQVTTQGPIITTLNSIQFQTAFTYTLTTGGQVRNGNANITSCGPATLGGGTPRRLINSQFSVRSGSIPARCALVSFDGSGSISTANPTVGACASTPTGCP